MTQCKPIARRGRMQMQAPSEALFLAQIVLLLLVGRLLGEAMQRIGQPAVMGQMIAGILLGPSVFGAIWPEAQRVVFAANPQQQSMIDAISQLGILMLLLLTGMETDRRLVKKARRAAIRTRSQLRRLECAPGSPIDPKRAMRLLQETSGGTLPSMK